MAQLQAITNEATEATMTQDDKMGGGMSLGGGAMNQQVTGTGKNQPTETKEPNENDNKLVNEPPYKPPQEPEKQKTQGELEQEIYKLENQNNTYQDIIDNYLGSINQFTNKFVTLPMNVKEDFIKYAGAQNTWSINKIKDYFNNKIASNKDLIYGIKNNSSYDNRTDEQRREDELREANNERNDTAYQRATEDMRQAGLNPMGLSSVNYGGSGGGGGGSKADEEEEKRKKRRREAEARRERERQKREAEKAKALELITGTVSGLTNVGIKSVGLGLNANMNNLYDNRTKAFTKQPSVSENLTSKHDFVNDYMKELEELEKKHKR